MGTYTGSTSHWIQVNLAGLQLHTHKHAHTHTHHLVHRPATLPSQKKECTKSLPTLNIQIQEFLVVSDVQVAMAIRRKF